MTSVKHQSICSGPLNGKSVEALPGIGPTYGGRLRSAGCSMASDLYERFDSMNFERMKCESWLNMVCGANSRYASMCYETLRDWHNQFGGARSSPRKMGSSSLQTTRLSTSSPSPSRSYYEEPDEIPAKNKEALMSRAEVLKLMADFQKKQDAMASRIAELEKDKTRTTAKINSLEADKTKTNDYVKSLEARVKKMERVNKVLQEQQNTSVKQYRNMSSSVYLISQKLEEVLTNQTDTIILTSIKILEKRIARLEENARNIERERSRSLSMFGLDTITKQFQENKIIREEVNKEIEKSINDITHKLNNIMEIHHLNHEKSVTKSLENKVQQIEKDLENITIDVRKLIKCEPKINVKTCPQKNKEFTKPGIDINEKINENLKVTMSC